MLKMKFFSWYRLNKNFYWLLLLMPLLYACPLLAETQRKAVSHEDDNHVIKWVLEDFPPFYIIGEKYKGHGTADRLIDLISKQMNGYEYLIERKSMLRLKDDLERGEHLICITYLKNKSIDEYVNYSIPVFVLLPQKLIVKKHIWEREFNRAENISLKTVLEKHNLTLGVAEGRDYGTVVDGLIKRLQESGREMLFTRPGDHFMGLAEMVSRERIDMTLGYEGELRYFNATRENPELVSVGITENSKPLFVYAALPKTDWGDAVLQHLNEAIIKSRQSKDYENSVKEWFGSSSETEAIYKGWRDLN